MSWLSNIWKQKDKNDEEKVSRPGVALIPEDDEDEYLCVDDDLDSVITLNDEDGNPVDFEFLDLISYRGKEYVVLLPEDEVAENAEVVILQVEETNDEEESYTSVDDDKTLNAVFDIFREKNEGMFNFID